MTAVFIASNPSSQHAPWLNIHGHPQCQLQDFQFVEDDFEDDEPRSPFEDFASLVKLTPFKKFSPTAKSAILESSKQPNEQPTTAKKSVSAPALVENDTLTNDNQHKSTGKKRKMVMPVYRKSQFAAYRVERTSAHKNTI